MWDYKLLFQFTFLIKGKMESKEGAAGFTGTVRWRG